MRLFTVGSLFSGIGGFDLGFDRAGFEVRWQVEIDEFCRKVLAKHWPAVRRYDDVRTFPPQENEDWQVDVIIGGFPCKQTSTGAAIHGRRVGLAGRDSGLWYEMLRVVRHLRPKFVVVENPPSKWLGEVASGLASAGYGVSRHEATAFDVGAPHLRRRVFTIAVYVEDGRRVVEDTKSEITRRHPVYRLKRRLIKAALGIDIRET